MTEGKQRARVEGRREGAGATLTNHAPLNTRNLSYSLLPFGLSIISKYTVLVGRHQRRTNMLPTDQVIHLDLCMCLSTTIRNGINRVKYTPIKPPPLIRVLSAVIGSYRTPLEHTKVLID